MRRVKVIGLIVFCLMVVPGGIRADGPGDDSAAPPAAEKEIAIEEVKEVTPPNLESATEEQAAEAVGHYLKARSLLIAAVTEFDDGYKVAKPDSILDSKAWRDSLISRAEDLEKVLAPQPRVTKGGVHFRGDNRLLQPEAKDK
jgi:hypothetical protein